MSNVLKITFANFLGIGYALGIVTLYPEALLNLLLSFNIYADSIAFSMHKIVFIDKFDSLLWNLYTFYCIDFSYRIATTSRILQNKSKSRCSCLNLHHRGKAYGVISLKNSLQLDGKRFLLFPSADSFCHEWVLNFI